MEPFIQCHYCKKTYTNPLELVCRHTFCSDCLSKEIKNDKIICPVCENIHAAPASALLASKKDNVAMYLIGLNSGEPYVDITDTKPASIQAQCAGCKKTTDLRVCFHCEKPLCADCRAKHHDAQKKEVERSMQGLTNKTGELITLTETLNASRNTRIQQYKIMKDQVTAHSKEVIKHIEEEEKDLLKTIDAEIEKENKHIAINNREQQYFQKNKAALEQMTDKYRNQGNQMVAAKMHKEYLDSAPTWKERLDSYSQRLHAQKPQDAKFQSTRCGPNDALVGLVIDAKNNAITGPAGIKRIPARTTVSGSRACVIS